MAVINTNAYGDLDLRAYSGRYWFGSDSAVYGYIFNTDKGSYVFVPDDIISKGFVDKSTNKQYHSPKLLDRNFLNELYTKYQPLDFGGFKDFNYGEQFYSRLDEMGYGSSGILMPNSDFIATIYDASNWYHYDIGRRIGDVSVGAIQGIGEKDGQLVYVPAASGADQASAYISGKTTYTTWQPELKWYQRLAQEIAKVPFLPEIAAIATTAMGGASYAPYVYGALKGAALGAQGVDPLKAGLMVGINLYAQNLASNSAFAKNIGATFGVTSEAMQLATGKAIIGASVNAMRAAVTGGDITKAMLDGALTAGASSMVPEIANKVLGTKASEMMQSIAKNTNLTQSQVQTIIASSFVSGIASEIKGGDFTKTFTNSLVGAGISQSVANEVGDQLGQTVSSEMRKAIVTGAATVAGTAATAALNNQDITKALEANLPATIYSTMNSYFEQKKLNEKAQSEGWLDNDQKVLAQAKWGPNTTPIEYQSKEQFVKDAEDFVFKAENYDTKEQAAEAAKKDGYNTFKWHDGKIYTLGGQSLTSMDTFVQAMNPGFDPVAYKTVNKLGPEISAADHYLDVGQYKNLPVNYEQYVDKTFASLPEYQAASAKDFYKEERDAAISAAKNSDFARVDEIAKFIDKTFTTEDEAKEYLRSAYQLAGDPGREPTNREIDLVRGKDEANAYTIAQTVSAIGVTTFDGTKFSTPKLAEEAAKKAGFNAFEANDGKTYRVTSTLDEANARANIEEQKTFRDAFAMARVQLGDGKTFTWNGKQYTTNVLPADTFDASRTGSIESAATLAYANGKTRFIASDGKIYNIPPEARTALENAVNQSPAETARLLRQAVTPEQNEYPAETQRLMESGTRSTMDNISATTAQLLGTSQRGVANFLSSAGKTYAAITGDLTFDNALTRLGKDIENYAKQNDVYGLDVQKNRINQAIGLANQTTDWWEKTKIIGSAIAKNPIGFFDIAGSETVAELPETVVQVGIALATGGAGIPAILAVSAGGTFLESFGNSAESAYNQSLAKGDSVEVAQQKAYLNAVVSTVAEIGPEMIADKALVAPFTKAIGDSLIGTTSKFVGGVAIGAASEFVSSVSQSYAQQLIVDSSKANFSSAVSDGIFGMYIGGTVQGALSLPGYAIQSGTVIGKDYNGNDVSIADILNKTKTLDSSTVDPNLVIGRTDSNNEITLGGAMTMMPSLDFNDTILAQYAPKVFANPELVVGKDALGNEVTYRQLDSQVTVDKSYSDVFNTVVNPSIDVKIDAQKNFINSEFKAIGFTPSPNQVDRLIVSDPQGNQSLVNTVKTFAFQEIAKEENYPLTTTETERLLRSGSNIQTVNQFKEYIDPLSVTAEEAREFLAEQGYTKPTETEILQLTQGNLPTKDDADLALQISVGRKPFDPKYDWNGDGEVTASDALSILKASQGRTDVAPPDIKTGWIPSESLSKVRATEIADPYVFDASEIQAIAASEGFAITLDEAKALAREETEEEAAQRYRQEIDPLAVTRAEAQEFFSNFGYAPTEDELIQFIASKDEKQIQADIQNYIDPRQITRVEAEQFFAELGYKPSEEEILQFMVSGPTIEQAKIKEQLSQYVDPRFVTEQEVADAYAALGLDKPVQKDIQALVGQYAQDLLAGRAEENLTAATINSIYSQLDDIAKTANQETLDAINKVRLDLTNQLNALGVDVGTAAIQDDPATADVDESRPATGLYAEIESQNKALNQKIAGVETSILSKMQEYEKSGIARDEALSKAIDDVSTDLGITRADLSKQIGTPAVADNPDTPEDESKAATGLYGVISGFEQQMAEVEAARKKEAIERAQAGERAKLGAQAAQLLAPAAAAVMPFDDSAKYKKPFITSTAKQEEFKGTLEDFQKEVEEGSYLKPSFLEEISQETPEMQRFMGMEENTQEGEFMPNYFTYGNQTDIDQVLNPFGQQSATFGSFEPFMAASGGLVPPLMAAGGATRYGRYAGGGLPVVAHSGKARLDFRSGAAVTGPGDGQSDDIPAMLADGEFVIPADVVAALGNGSTKAGSDKLYDMMHSIRSYHRSAKPKDLPPPAKKNPLDYLSKSSKGRS